MAQKTAKKRTKKKAKTLDHAELERRRKLRRARNQRYQANLKKKNGTPHIHAAAMERGAGLSANEAGEIPREKYLVSLSSKQPVRQEASHTVDAAPCFMLWVSPGETREAYLRRPREPIPNGITPHVDLRSKLGELNKMLYSWGFLAVPHLELRAIVRSEALEARKTPDTWTTWCAEKERWMEDGDRILTMMETALSGELFFMLPEDVLQREWQSISSVAFRVQYMIATVEAQMDAFDL